MTAFSNDVTESLAAPLAREHVKGRKQGNSTVSYIEGWHAIAEANRIFGFDGWTRETIMSECCHAGDYEKAVWENGKRTNRTITSHRCSYRARVRVTAMGIVREGSGHGHGFADNPGEAHESAEKEAETDAMKRALMTFGNPFGLALYDKTQAEVEPMPGRAAPIQSASRTVDSRRVEEDPFTPKTERAEHPRRAEALDAYTRIKVAMNSARTPKMIDELIKANDVFLALIKEVHAPTYEDLMALSAALKAELLAAA